jgi:hypothetical protein
MRQGIRLTSNIANINTLTSVNGSITTLTSTSGTITTFNFENATGSSLYANTIQATTVSSTAMFVNGVAVCLASGTNCPTGTTPNLQTVTNAGNTTTNAIQFAGGTSTADFVFNTSCDGQRRLHGQWREQSPERFLLECHGFQPLRLASHGYQWHDRYPCFDQWHHHFLVGYLGHDHQPFAASTTVTGTLTANNATASTLQANIATFATATVSGQAICLQWRWLSFGCGRSDTFASVTNRGSFATSRLRSLADSPFPTSRRRVRPPSRTPPSRMARRRTSPSRARELGPCPGR